MTHQLHLACKQVHQNTIVDASTLSQLYMTIQANGLSGSIALLTLSSWVNGLSYCSYSIRNLVKSPHPLIDLKNKSCKSMQNEWKYGVFLSVVYLICFAFLCYFPNQSCNQRFLFSLQFILRSTNCLLWTQAWSSLTLHIRYHQGLFY